MSSEVLKHTRRQHFKNGCIYQANDSDKWALWSECRLAVPKKVTSVVVRYPRLLRMPKHRSEELQCKTYRLPHECSNYRASYRINVQIQMPHSLQRRVVSVTKFYTFDRLNCPNAKAMTSAKPTHLEPSDLGTKE